MKPGKLGAPVYKRAKFEHRLILKQKGTTTPLDLTGLGPFVATLNHPTQDKVIATGTITSDYDDTGVLTFSFTAAQTDLLKLGTCRFGLRDAVNNLYIQEEIPVLYASPPAA